MFSLGSVVHLLSRLTANTGSSSCPRKRGKTFRRCFTSGVEPQRSHLQLLLPAPPPSRCVCSTAELKFPQAPVVLTARWVKRLPSPPPTSLSKIRRRRCVYSRLVCTSPLRCEFRCCLRATLDSNAGVLCNATRQWHRS